MTGGRVVPVCLACVFNVARRESVGAAAPTRPYKLYSRAWVRRSTTVTTNRSTTIVVTTPLFPSSATSEVCRAFSFEQTTCAQSLSQTTCTMYRRLDKTIGIRRKKEAKTTPKYVPPVEDMAPLAGGKRKRGLGQDD